MTEFGLLEWAILVVFIAGIVQVVSWAKLAAVKVYKWFTVYNK